MPILSARHLSQLLTKSPTSVDLRAQEKGGGCRHNTHHKELSHPKDFGIANTNVPHTTASLATNRSAAL
jgi:hypothetical protein